MGEALRYCLSIMLVSPRAVATGVFGLFILAPCFQVELRAQNLVRLTDAPPPLQYLPADLRATLAAEERDQKKRTRLTLEMADGRLLQATQSTAEERYGAASAQLGVYQALVADVIQYLQQAGKSNNKIRDLSKRVEMTLRSHIPRIEAIRRTTPSEEAQHVRAVIEYLRLARAEALNTFYGDTVVRDDANP